MRAVASAFIVLAQDAIVELMQVSSDSLNRTSPESLLTRLLARLRNYALRDSVLLFAPPCLSVLYVVIYLYLSSWLPQIALIAISVAAVGLVVLAGVAHYRRAIPSLRATAQLLDARTAAKDRFMTLATIEASSCSIPFLSRLRHEASVILQRLEWKRAFPYRMKPSFYRSAVGSIIAVVLFHSLWPFMQAQIYSPSPHEPLRALAEKMAHRPGLSELARDLQALAGQIEDPNISPQQKQSLIQDTQKKIDEQQKREDQKENRDLLGQAASTLRGLEQQQSGGQERQQEEEKAGGGVQSKLPQEGEGQGRPNTGKGGESQGELGAQLSKEMQQGKSAQGDPREQASQEKQQSQGDGKGDQPEPGKPNTDGKEGTGRKSGGSEEKVGKSKASEEIPQGAPPAERFYQAGEQGQEGIKGAGYVTVQLPEEVAADSKSEGPGTKESQAKRARSNAPVSNVPLPAHVPDAPAEKQPMPLEYRGIIR